VELNSIGTFLGWAVGWSDASALAGAAGKTPMNPRRKFYVAALFLLAFTQEITVGSRDEFESGSSAF
jgi:hypothetical protein